ncbi:type IV secretion system protein [Negativicoccus succinicivorans]|uniref:type IV secretion system protein n=1 Tax=Negativicoccus succinicivorans TaxID=620903 RepID=UPI00290BACE0|nr:type IV secretion system protein [Negativicoccus succinicivorans]MDU5530065.1 type IV secretion system protein [Negativicoccus succinicivorans]MDU5631899.1 type IV secretion system protein [Enterococcus faecalis]
MNFESPQSFQPSGQAVDRFVKGRNEFLAFYEGTMQHMANWRRLALISSATCLVCIGITGYLATRSEYIPYLVRIDSQTGYTEAVGPINKVDYTPQEAEIKYFLNQLIMQTRSVPLDPVVLNKQWQSAAALMSAGAFSKMQDYANQEGLFDKMGHFTVTPKLMSISRLANTTNTYQIRWEESEFGINGGAGKKRKYLATVTYELSRPEDELALYQNPLGIMVTDVSMTKENVAEDKK